MNAAPSPVVPGLEQPEAIGRGGFGTVLVSRFAEPALGDFGISRLPGLP